MLNICEILYRNFLVWFFTSWTWIQMKLIVFSRLDPDLDPDIVNIDPLFLGRSVAMGKPVLALYRPQEGRLLSGMIRGTSSTVLF